MANKPQTEHHDVQDYRCSGHEQAKRIKGVKRDLSRRCPICVPQEDKA
jgi:hypothetical protein